MDLIGKIFLMITEFLLTRKTVIEFISCPAKLVGVGFPVRVRPFAAAILCSKTATSIVSKVAVKAVYQVAVAYQLVLLCRSLFFFALFIIALFSLSWSDLVTTVEDGPSSASASASCPDSSCPDPPSRYDVFISFRGPDARNSLVSHLFDAMCRAKIKAFMDHLLQKGEEIAPGLLKVIEQSKISVVVLSENYASSHWCLEELVKIMECKERRGQIVLPVFYGVEPREVRRQTGRFGSEFAAMYENAPREQGMTTHKINTWRYALTRVSKLFGYDSDVVRSEAELVNNIVDDVVRILKNPELHRTRERAMTSTGLGEASQGTELARATTNDRHMQIVSIGGDEVAAMLVSRMQEIEEQRERDRRLQEEQAEQIACLTLKLAVMENILTVVFNDT